MHTTKTFKLVAEAIRTRIASERAFYTCNTERSHREDALLDLAVDFAHIFKKENPKFSTEKFMAAVKK